MLNKLQNKILNLFYKDVWIIPADLQISLSRERLVEELDVLTKLKLLKFEVLCFRNRKIKRYSITKTNTLQTNSGADNLLSAPSKTQEKNTSLYKG